MTFYCPEKILKRYNMKKGVLTVVLSVLVSGLTAYAIVKNTAPEADQPQQQIVYSQDGQAVRTVNLSLSDYPDFTYAAENAVQAVVYVKVTVRSQQQQVDIVAEAWTVERAGYHQGLLRHGFV